MNKPALPQSFIWRRLHSITGLGLIVFILFHLTANSSAAFWSGTSYIDSVNAIQDIPYLRFVELFLLGLPLAIHAIWGMYYLFTGKENYYRNSEKDPYLPEYERNRAYTWQRITSWILLIGIIAHVIHMRFIEQPIAEKSGSHMSYSVSLSKDEGLDSVASRLGVVLKKENGDLRGVTKDFGTAELLMVREAFKSPWIMLLYTIFVLAACFHAFNGLWTFAITWGITLTVRSQMIFLRVTTLLMFGMTFLGLSTIYLTYWVNLRH